MIRYALRCDQGHDFDGWFRSSQAYEEQCARGFLSCAECGSTRIEKRLMSPAVAPKTPKAPAPAQEATPPAPQPPSAEKAAEAAIAKLRDEVERNSDYVGMKFVDEARAMHEGRSDRRAIHGEARPDEARKLLEDGVPVAPLPFIPKQKQN